MENFVITKEDIQKIRTGDSNLFESICAQLNYLLDNVTELFPFINPKTFTLLSRKAFMILFEQVNLDKNYDIRHFVEINYLKAFKITLKEYSTDNIFELVDDYIKLVKSNKLDSLIQFMKYLKYKIDINFCVEILNIYSDINDEVASLIGNNDNDTEGASKNKTYSLFINAYKVKNNIVQEEVEELLNNNTPVLSDNIVPVLSDNDDPILDDKIENSQDSYVPKSIYSKVSHTQLLSEEEEKRLFEEYRNGSQDAFNKIFNANLRLVISMAGHYAKGDNFDDLFQEGSIGLSIAIERFDPSLGTKFSTYAYPWIFQRITRFLTLNSSAIRTSVAFSDMSRKVKKIAQNYLNEHGVEASYEELAKMAGCTVETVKNTFLTFVDTVSLSTPIGEESHGNSSEMGDFLADEYVNVEGTAIDKSLKDMIISLVKNSNVPEKYKEILFYRFGLYGDREYTLDEIGQMFELTRERVRQIINKTIVALKKDENTFSLVDYADHPDKAREYLESFRNQKKKRKPYAKRKPRASKKTIEELNNAVIDTIEDKTLVGNESVSVDLPKPSIVSDVVSEEVVEHKEEFSTNVDITLDNSSLVPNDLVADKNEEKKEVLSDADTAKHQYGLYNKSIFKYLCADKSQREIIMDLLSCIPSDDLRIIKINCGENFDGINASALYKGDKTKFKKRIIPKLRDAFNDIKDEEKGSIAYSEKLTSFRLYYNKRSVSRSKSLIKYLNLSNGKNYILKDLFNNMLVTDVELFKQCYGEDLNGTQDVELPTYLKNRKDFLLHNLRKYVIKLYNLDRNSEEYQNIMKEFREFSLVRKATTSMIFYYLDVPNSKRFMLMDLINHLSKSDYEILKVNCGENFDGKSIRRLTTSERNRMFEVIFPKLETYYRLIQDLEPSSDAYKSLIQQFYNLFNESVERRITSNIFCYIDLAGGKEQVLLDIINILGFDYVSTLKKNCGPKYDGVGAVDISLEETRELHGTIIPLLKQGYKMCSIYSINSSEYKRALEKFRTIYLQRRFKSCKSLVCLLNVKEEDMQVLFDLVNLYHPLDKEIMYKKYGEKLDGFNGKRVLTKEQNRLHDLFTKLYTFYDQLINLKMDSEKYKAKLQEIHNIVKAKYVLRSKIFYYLKVSDDKKYVLLDLINHLDLEDRKLIELYCGTNLDGQSIRKLSDSEKERLIKLLYVKLSYFYQKLKDVSQDSQEYYDNMINFRFKVYGYDQSSLFDMLNVPDSKKDYLLDLISLMTASEKDKLKECFGDNYDGIGLDNNAFDIVKERKALYKLMILMLKEWYYKLSKFEKDSDQYKGTLQLFKGTYDLIAVSTKSKRKKIYEFFDVPKENKKVLLDILWKLPEADLNIVKGYFGENLEQDKSGNLFLASKSRFYSIIVRKVSMFYKTLVVYPIGSDEYNNCLNEFLVFYSNNNRNVARNLITYFNNEYTFEDLQQAIMKLSKDDSDLIYRACGPKLNGLDGDKLSKNEGKDYLSRCLRHLKDVLNSNNTNVSIDEKEKQVNGVSDNELVQESENKKMRKNIKNLISYLDVTEENKGVLFDIMLCLDSDDYKLFKCYCGENLDGVGSQNITTVQRNRLNNCLAQRVSDGYNILVKLKNDEKKYRDAMNSFYEKWTKRKPVNNLIGYFENKYTYDEITKVLSDSMRQVEVDLIYRVCGQKLDGVGSCDTKEEHSKFIVTVFPKLKNKLSLAYPQKSNIFSTGALQGLGTTSIVSDIATKDDSKALSATNTTSIVKEQIEEVVNNNIAASESETENVLNDNSVVTDAYTKEVENQIDNISEDVSINSINLVQEDYEFIEKIISSSEFKNILKNRFTVEEIMISTMLYYGYKDRRYSVQEIAKIMDTTPEDIIDIVRRTLAAYKKFTSEKLDAYEQKLTKTII